MEINKVKNGRSMEFKLAGRLDTNTAPDLTEEVNASVTEEIEEVIFDFKSLDYISSAGLRVILMTQKMMNSRKGSMVVRHPNQIIAEVFEATGFTDIMTIEP